MLVGVILYKHIVKLVKHTFGENPKSTRKGIKLETQSNGTQEKFKKKREKKKEVSNQMPDIRQMSVIRSISTSI